MIESLSLVLARYDPFGVDVPVNFDNTHSLTQIPFESFQTFCECICSTVTYHIMARCGLAVNDPLFDRQLKCLVRQ